MATYCYVHPKTKKLYDEQFPIGEAPPHVEIDGVKCERCLAAEFASQGGLQPSTWPMKSMALAVHPSQRKEYSEFAAKHGVPTYFDEKGRPEFRTKKHRKQYAELVGATDYDGGCGDPRCD